MGEVFILKTDPFAGEPGQRWSRHERLVYDGPDPAAGDDVYVWFSGGGAEAGLVWRGRIETARIADSQAHLELRLLARAEGEPLTNADLAPFRDVTGEDPMVELSHKLYRHAHNKVAPCSAAAAVLLRSHFPEAVAPAPQAPEAVMAPRPSAVSPIWLAATAVGALVLVVAVVGLADRSLERDDLPTTETPAATISDAPAPPPASVASPTGREVRAIGPSGEAIVLNVLSSAPAAIANQMAVHIRDAGFPCDQVLTASQLQQKDGQTLPIWKIDCSDGRSYQATELNGRPFLKPWTGRLLG